MTYKLASALHKHYTSSATQQQVQRAPGTVSSALFLESFNVTSQQFKLSKGTFRWTFQRAKIDFNRLKILIFPANNQGNFPSRWTSQSKSVGRSESGAEGGFDAVHSPLHCFLLASLHLGQMEAKLELNPLRL